MKKILSLTLVLAMVMSMGITTAFAAGNWEGGTQVTYTATGAEEWTVTVPATLAPGASGDVVAEGTWGSDRKLVVTADENVVLTNSINAADQKDLAVTFPGIELAGSNTAAVSDTKAVSVATMPADALFGTWSGTFYYDVEMVDNVEMITFTYKDQTYQVEAGTTWRECSKIFEKGDYENTFSVIGGENNPVYAYDMDVGGFIKKSNGEYLLADDALVDGESYTIDTEGNPLN